MTVRHITVQVQMSRKEKTKVLNKTLSIGKEGRNRFERTGRENWWVWSRRQDQNQIRQFLVECWYVQ